MSRALLQEECGVCIMPFEIIRNDIANMRVDAIVNTTGAEPWIGSGVDAGVHQKAGPKLLEARQAIGSIPVGGAAVTPGFELPAKYVIHTVAPLWEGGGRGEELLLRGCYRECLALAKELGCRSLAFPLLSAGNLGFPRDLALQVALGAISEFLMANELQVYLVVFNREAFLLSEKLFRGVSSFIDENYIQAAGAKQRRMEDSGRPDLFRRGNLFRRGRRQKEEGIPPTEDRCLIPPPCASAEPLSRPAPVSYGLKELLDNTDSGFSETLLRLIDERGMKDSEIYNRANISRQHFSKIRNNPAYKPSKATAVAFAIALELDLEQTRDLIGRAGYALTNSSKFDVIIMYFIRERNYNMFDINAALFEFDQSLLGASS